MNKLKALVVTLLVGSSSVAMAAPATFSARGSVSFDVRTPNVVVRDHRTPQYREPVYQRPVYQQPVYQQPVYHQPAYYEDDCAQFSISGSFSSAFGPVQLRQYGDRVTGTFTAGGGGTIEGRIVGNQIIFSWKNTAERGRGVWLIKNDNRINGTWGTNSSQTDGGAWNLSRV